MYKNESNKLVICDFEKEKDTECLEKIFKKDFNMLIRDATEYKNNMGCDTFFNLVSDTTTSVRKIVRDMHDDKKLSVGFFIYFVLYKNTLYKNFKDGDVALVLMGVDPDQRRVGHGSFIMHHMKERALSLGAEKLWLSVNKNNKQAQSFYEKFGFSSTGDVSSNDSYWWSAYIFNGSVNKRTLYDTLIEQKFCDISLKFN